MIPQLPTEVNDTECEKFLGDDQWAMSQKLDGHRLVLSSGNGLKRYNRHGDETPVPVVLQQSKLARTEVPILIDGEFLDETLWVFDILELNGKSLLKFPWFARVEVAAALVEKLDDPVIKSIPYWDLLTDKHDMFDKLRNNNAEGVVFADKNGRYHQGRSKSLLKFKFLKEVDCIVTDKNLDDKDNLELAVMRDGAIHNVGRVSALTGDGPNIKVGDVVTVTVLYSTEGGRLFHPVKPKLRTDKLPEECTYDQIEVIKLNKKVLA